MGGLFKAIGNFFGKIVDFVWDSICSIMDTVWQFVSHNIIEPVMNFLGFEDETIIMTDVIATKIFDKSILPDTRIQAALTKQDEDTGLLDYLSEFDARGNAQFNRYFRKGKNDYTDHLPECQINAITVSNSEVKNILEKELGTSVNIQNILISIPSDINWCKYQLQQQYNYNISSDFVIINNNYYTFSKQVYNSSTNTFTVTLNNLSSVREKIYETTSIFVAGTTEVETETGTTTITETKEIKRTLVYQYSEFSRVDNGAYLNETDEVLVSSTDELVDVGTTVVTTYIDLVSDTIVNYSNNPITVSINNHNNERCYTVFYRKDDNRTYLWIYNTSSNIYPELSSPVNKIEGFETYPIVCIRNGFFDVDEYNISSKNTDDGAVSRPPTITKERYKDTASMLSSLGLNVDDLIKAYKENPDIDKIQDVFFGLAISPSNTSEIVSKVLYEIFDFIYDELPPINYSNSYSASFKEDPFNAAITWLPREVSINEGKIGNIGFCRHTITNATYRAVGSTQTYVKVTAIEYGWDSNGDYGPIQVSYNIRKDEVSEIYREGVLISRDVIKSTNVFQIKGMYDSYPIEEMNNSNIAIDAEYTHIDIKEDVTTIGKDLTIEYQLTNDTFKRIGINKLDGFHIIRRGVNNGGVTLPIDNKNFVIPIPVPVVERLSLIEKTALISEAAYMIFYAYDEQHLRWYETPRFAKFLQVIMLAIVVVIIIFSFGTMTGPATTLYAAAQAALMLLIKIAVLTIVCNLLLKFIASTNWSPQLKAAMSAIVMIGAAYAGGAFNNIAMTALTLTSITSNAISIYSAEQVEDLQDEMNSVYSNFSERKSELDEVQKSLETGISTDFVTDLTTDISLMSGTNSSIGLRFYQPDEFFYVAKGNMNYNYDLCYRNSVSHIKDNYNNLYATY